MWISSRFAGSTKTRETKALSDPSQWRVGGSHGAWGWGWACAHHMKGEDSRVVQVYVLKQRGADSMCIRLTDNDFHGHLSRLGGS